ncbi:putative transposase [Paracoccus aminovorans]|uniref:Putative transposase n=1 Tax=Paracoccus aminovorans TaxID=34004 RepID=A0A1I2YWP7_9RHOB|nr:transposase [Paracoccus aminovorans]SFH29566.1 putative transposase [Paracoccus aminovorans]
MNGWTIEKPQQIATDRLWTCNNERPAMGTGSMKPAQKPKMTA